MSDVREKLKEIFSNYMEAGCRDTMAEDTVTLILRKALQLEDDCVLTDATRLQEIPNLDSLGQVRMVMEIEEVLGERLSMEEIIAIESVGNIRDLLAAKGKLRAER